MPNVLIYGDKCYGDLILPYIKEGYKVAYFQPGNYFNTSYCEPVHLCRAIAMSDIIILTGGSDVHPRMYKESNRHATTVPNLARDLADLFLFKMGRRYGKKFVGICRGAQFLCTRAGGKVIQNVTGHRVYGSSDKHSLHTTEGRVGKTNRSQCQTK